VYAFNGNTFLLILNILQASLVINPSNHFLGCFMEISHTILHSVLGCISKEEEEG